jgi:actin-like ATPase involved in cell morphogenesis
MSLAGFDVTRLMALTNFFSGVKSHATMTRQITEPQASMIVDIGGGTCEIAIISLAGIVFSRSLRVGGDEFDETIVAHMKRAYNLMIGERTAEEIKIRIGSAFPLEQELTMEVKGRDLSAGLPKTITIRSEEIREALKEPLTSILESVRITLERCPPELSADLICPGCGSTGAAMRLRGCRDLLMNVPGELISLNGPSGCSDRHQLQWRHLRNRHRWKRHNVWTTSRALRRLAGVVLHTAAPQK